LGLGAGSDKSWDEGSALVFSGNYKCNKDILKSNPDREKLTKKILSFTKEFQIGPSLPTKILKLHPKMPFCGSFREKEPFLVNRKKG
jgi:hypothetical protein